MSEYIINGDTRVAQSNYSGLCDSLDFGDPRREKAYVNAFE